MPDIRTASAQLMPDTETLFARLEGLLREKTPERRPLAITDRRAIVQGTYPKEIVTCRFRDEPDRRYFCKYAVGDVHGAFGHRGGLGHEVEMYTRVLPSAPLPLPELVGGQFDPVTEESWLIIEFVERAYRVAKSPDPSGMPKAAAWIGAFHRHFEGRTLPETSLLQSYDAAYYEGWMRRARAAARRTGHDAPWFLTLCDRYPGVAERLLARPQTLIHGEYYFKNILYGDGVVYPVDWESAALGAGVVDLAMLTDAWPPDAARACASAYVEARWSGDAPDGFTDALTAARLYVNFRWLEPWVFERGGKWLVSRMKFLKHYGERLDLL